MAGEIEFLDDNPPPHPEHAPARRRRWRVLAVLAVAGLLLAIVVARAVTGGGAGDRSTSARAAVSGSSSGSSSDGGGSLITYCVDIVQVPVRPLPTGTVAPGQTEVTLDPQTGHTVCSTVRPTACPARGSHPGCTTTSALPGGFLVAVRSRFPGAQLVSAQSQITRGSSQRLWGRSVVLRSGNEQIRVVVTRRGTQLGYSGVRDDGSQRVSRVVADGTTYDAVVEVTSPSGTQSDLDTIGRLAHDARLDALH